MRDEPLRCPLLAVGHFRSDAGSGIEAAATAVGATTHFIEPGHLSAALDGNPLALLLRMDDPGAAAACLEMRAQPRSAGVPILGSSPRRGDLAFTELFCWGGDDLVEPTTPDALIRRLRAVIAARAEGSVPPAVDRGIAVVAANDRSWRSVMGRTLHGAGYRVRFVGTSDELRALGPEVRVVVAADDLEADGAAAAAIRARADGSAAAWVVVAPPKRMVAAHRAIGKLLRAAAVDSFAPPENVLFVLNELIAAWGSNQRRSPRVLYGTAVTFRTAGRDEDEVGFSYNISAAGLYVRTLAPPEPGQEVWLDAWTPRSQRRVRLAGTVAWRRLFGEATKTGVPPGFGIKLEDGLSGDLERWRVGYDEVARSMRGSCC